MQGKMAERSVSSTVMARMHRRLLSTSARPLTSIDPYDMFIDSLTLKRQLNSALKMCVLAWEISEVFRTHICPREWQI
jgi:hypothetical protein